MTSEDPCSLDLLEAGAKVRNREITSRALTQAMLDRIARLEPKLRSYATVTNDLALQQADVVDREISQGRHRGPLHGVPIAVKDLCWTKGIPTAAGMTIHRDYRPARDATVVTRLAAAGAVLLGKLQMTEGAFGAHHPKIDPPRNPWSAAHWPGVSSSGSGVATAACLCFASLGSDTGGSIRYPSTMNGITGLKPTWGRVSRFGVFALAESLDHIGPMTRSAADAAAVLGAIAGPDADDPTAALEPVPDYLAGIGQPIAGLRIGIDRAYNSRDCDADVLNMMAAAERVLTSLGGVVREIAIPSPDQVIADWTALCGIETALAHEQTYPQRAGEYGPRLAWLIDLGRSTGSIDMARMLVHREVFRGRLAAMFRDIDLLLIPTMPAASPTLAQIEAESARPETRLRRMRYTSPFDMSGSPTITLPGGSTAGGMPVGFQLVGRHFDEALLLRAGHAFQQASDWHRQRPPL